MVGEGTVFVGVPSETKARVGLGMLDALKEEKRHPYNYTAPRKHFPALQVPCGSWKVTVHRLRIRRLWTVSSLISWAANPGYPTVDSGESTGTILAVAMPKKRMTCWLPNARSGAVCSGAN